MPRLLDAIPRAVFILGGITIGAVSILWKSRETAEHSAPLRRGIADLEAKMSEQSMFYRSKLEEIEQRLEHHDTRLRDVPTIAQIVSTMETMLGNTMSGLDRKLADQVRSIEVLKTTVVQTDELMERVLDSIYSLQSNLPDGDKPEVSVSV
jgi:hypothetical protein